VQQLARRHPPTDSLEHMAITAPNMNLADSKRRGGYRHWAVMLAKSKSCGHLFMPFLPFCPTARTSQVAETPQ